MAKIVKMNGNVVQEIISECALPGEKFYGAAFAAQCVEAPDQVDQRWVLHEDGSWSEPVAVTEPDLQKPATQERITALEAALAQTDETAIALYEGQLQQEEINAAQDEALIELYEMMEG